MIDFCLKSTAPSSGYFRRQQSFRYLFTTAVSARPAINLEITLTRIHGGLQIWLQSFYKVYKKVIVNRLKKNHSVWWYWCYYSHTFERLSCVPIYNISCVRLGAVHKLWPPMIGWGRMFTKSSFLIIV